MKVLIVLGFVVGDIITGFIKALYKKRINSTALRSGLFHKSAEVMAVFVAYGLQCTANFYNLGVELPLVGVVSAYIIIMEIVSILENICTLNPGLQKLFKPYLEKLKGDDK